jgi:arylsulfatase A-like enzyme
VPVLSPAMDRRGFLRAAGLGAAALLAPGRGLWPALAEAAGAGGERPNIVLFLVDDLGWQDLSEPFDVRRSPSNDRYKTPNVERLARQGVKFTQAYASSVCSPTRISLMTGMNAARHRVTNWTLRRNEGTDAAQDALILPEWNVNGMSPVPGIERTAVATPLPALLKAAGYATIHVGKAHFGAVGTPAADPLNIGFEVNVAGHAAGGPGGYLGIHDFSAVWRKGDPIWDIPGLDEFHGQDIFLTEALTRRALDALRKPVAEGRPFFLYMSHYAVHAPIEEDARFVTKYLDAGLDPIEARYAALVEGVDKSLGDILGYLDRKGLSGKTIVLFMSDNGGLSAEGRGGTPNTHNKPLSSGKGSAREGGIREPMIVRWPGVTEAGRIEPTPVIIEDFFPSLLEMAGAGGAETVQPVDGTSFVPLLRGKGSASKDRALFWHFPNFWGPKGPGIGASSTVRKGDWKLIYYHADRSFELFNLAEDIGEANNRADREPDRVRTLAALLTAHLKSVDAQMPRDKKTGRPVEWPAEAAAARVQRQARIE